MMQFFTLFKNTYKSWDKNDPWAKSAVIAYYALFSLPSLLMITLYVTGLFLGREAVQGKITAEIGAIVGVDAAQAIENMIANAALEESTLITVVLGIGMLIFGATGVFFQLQKALNDIWSVRAKKNTIWDTIKRRAVSFSLILVIGFLLLISLVISSAIDAFTSYLATFYSEVSSILLGFGNFLISEFFMAALFASIFTLLPDVTIKLKTAILGGIITALLFLAGKYILGYYFSQANPASVYGAAGSLVLILLWVYYTCLILFFGAEFTVQWALHRNIKVCPNANATLSYEREIEELRQYKKSIEENKKKAQQLESN